MMLAKAKNTAAFDNPGVLDVLAALVAGRTVKDMFKEIGGLSFETAFAFIWHIHPQIARDNMLWAVCSLPADRFIFPFRDTVCGNAAERPFSEKDNACRLLSFI